MDNYKEIKNYIHNELQITKTDIENIIIKTVENRIDKVLADDDFINTIIQKKIQSILNNPYKKPSWERLVNLNTKIFDVVVDEVAKTVKEKVDIRIKEI
jgi:hypothetical protein